MDWSEQFGPTQRTLQLEKTTSVKLHDDSSLDQSGDYTDGFYSDRVEICSEGWTPRGGNRIVYGPGHSQERERIYEFKDQTTSRSMLEGSMELKLSNHEKKKL